MEDPPIFKFGKPSISIRAIEKPWRTVNVITRGYHIRNIYQHHNPVSGDETNRHGDTTGGTFKPTGKIYGVYTMR